MSKSLLILLAVAVTAFLLCDFASAHCRRSDRRCCRKKISYGNGKCHHHYRRWGYNASCGQCVQFDWSGCGDDDNVFESQNDCFDCCKGTHSCPRYSLPKPPTDGCTYKWHDGPDGCPRPRLDCDCRPAQCRPDSCRHGERCIREDRPCHGHRGGCGCKQYRCETDPCYAIAIHIRPCEKCVAVPEPTCHHRPCRLIAYREDYCPTTTTTTTTTTTEAPRCHFFVRCPPEGDSCRRSRCPHYPRARCIVDRCDCRRHYWYGHDGHRYDDDDCYGRK